MTNKVFVIWFEFSSTKHWDKIVAEKQILKEISNLKKELNKKYAGKAEIKLIEI